jgi:hypothetical protein
MHIKDTSLVGDFVNRWNATTERMKEMDIIVADIIAKSDDMIEEVKILHQKMEALLVKQQQAKQTKLQPSVVNSINVDLGTDYNTYLTNIFIVYAAAASSPTEPVFFQDSKGEQQLLEWADFSELYREYVFTVLESHANA